VAGGWKPGQEAVTIVQVKGAEDLFSGSGDRKESREMGKHFRSRVDKMRV
jgi:hypothetical protein